MSDKPHNSASLNLRPEVEPIAMPWAYGVLESTTFSPETVSGFKPVGGYGSSVTDDVIPDRGGKQGGGYGCSVTDDPETDPVVKPGAYSVG